MKRTFVIFIVFIFSISLFGEVPNALFGVNLNSTEASAIVTLSKRFSIIGKPVKDGIFGKVLFRGIMFGYMDSILLIESIRGKVFSIAVILNADATASISTFNEMRSLLINKYGNPDNEIRKYEYPYEANDGFTLQGINNNKITIADVWDKETSDCRAILTIGNILKISLIYFHKGLEEEKNKIIAGQKSSDL